MLRRGVLGLYIGLLLGGTAWAETTFPGQPPKAGFRVGASFPPTVTSSYSGAGDVTTFLHYYGLWAYSNAQAIAHQKLVGVVNTSTSETCDIDATSTGGLGLTASCSGSSSGIAVTTFCGVVGSGAGVCTIGTTYDLVGTGNFTRQGSAINLGLIFNCTGIGTNPCMQTGSTGLQFLVGTWAANPGQPFTYSGAAIRTGSGSNMAFIGNNNVAQLGSSTTANRTLFYAGTLATAQVLSDNAWHSMQGTFNASTSVLNIDGTDITGLATGSGVISTASNASGIGSNGSGTGNIYVGDITEIGLLAGDPGSTVRGQLCHAQNTHAGLGLSC